MVQHRQSPTLIAGCGSLCIHSSPGLNAFSSSRRINLDNDCNSQICNHTGFKAREAVMISWSDSLTFGVTQGREIHAEAPAQPCGLNLWLLVVRNYGLLQSPDDGESPHPSSGIAVVCYTQWVTLTQILLSLTGLLSTWKSGNQDILQILFQYNTNKNLMLDLWLSLKHPTEIRAGAQNIWIFSIKCHWREENLLSTYIINLKTGVLSNQDIVI